MQCGIIFDVERKLFKILGFGVDSFNKEDALEYILQNHGQVVTINPEMIMNAAKSGEFANVINSAELVIPDSVGVELGLKILGHKVPRIPGVEFGKELLRRCAKLNKSVALVGAKHEVIELAVKNLKNELPDLNIAYWHDGYFSDDSIIKTQLVEVQPDLVLVALGAPKQEFFNFDLKKQLPESVMVGVGGSFDVWAGVVERAPEIYQKLGLEWLYRTVMQPQRIKRIFPTLPLFVMKVFIERVFGNHA